MSAVERAFQLARDGTCRSVEDIRRSLRAEQILGADAHLTPSLRKQLRSIMAEAAAAKNKA